MSATGRQRYLAVLGMNAWLVIGAVAVIVVAFFFDPAREHWLPACPLHALTGLHCPGCGTTRALHQLLHGHLVAALHLNLLTILLFPALGILALTRRPSTWRPGIVWTLVVVVIVFGVLRNVPLYPFTLFAP